MSIEDLVHCPKCGTWQHCMPCPKCEGGTLWRIPIRHKPRDAPKKYLTRMTYPEPFEISTAHLRTLSRTVLCHCLDKEELRSTRRVLQIYVSLVPEGSRDISTYTQCLGMLARKGLVERWMTNYEQYCTSNCQYTNAWRLTPAGVEKLKELR